MGKLFLLALFLSNFFVLVPEVDASMVLIQRDGDMIVNVLSLNDEAGRSDLEVTKVAAVSDSDDARISLQRNEETVNMTIYNSQGKRELDVTDYKDSLVEIEEIPKPKKTTIGIEGETFFIRQGSVEAKTMLPITVQAEEKTISVKTSTGEKFLSVLPHSAADSIFKTRIINKITDGGMTINEEEEELMYTIKGKKIVNMLNIYDFELDVIAKVSATTGEIIGIQEPGWLKSLNFLFV